MARLILGNGSGAVALAGARSVLAELVSEWPDLNLTQRSFREPGADGEAPMTALAKGQIQLAAAEVAQLPPTLPAGLKLAAVTKRLEPRYTLITRAGTALAELNAEHTVGCLSERDGAFVRALKGDLRTVQVTGSLDDQLRSLSVGEPSALLLPCAHLIRLERRQLLGERLEPEIFPPAAGQGCTGLIVREDDDLAAELAYSLQHRPSFDRVIAERRFAAALEVQSDYAVGCLARVSSDGDFTLFGAVTHKEKALTIQADISGDASEAAALGAELGADVLAQLAS